MNEFERSIGFADSFGTRARVSFMPAEDAEDEATIHLSVEAGMCGGRGIIPAGEARRLAAALLDAADAAEGVAA